MTEVTQDAISRKHLYVKGLSGFLENSVTCVTCVTASIHTNLATSEEADDRLGGTQREVYASLLTSLVALSERSPRTLFIELPCYEPPRVGLQKRRAEAFGLKGHQMSQMKGL